MLIPLNYPYELTGPNFEDPMRCEWGMIDFQQWWTMFANVPESTRIYIKMDDTHIDQYETFEE